MENEYSTKDFYLATILLCSKKVILLRLDQARDGFVTFVFDDPHKLAKELISNHWNRKNKVISLDLIEAINQLKTRIHNGI
jgi:hypothetical protein